MERGFCSSKLLNLS